MRLPPAPRPAGQHRLQAVGVQSGLHSGQLGSAEQRQEGNGTHSLMLSRCAPSATADIASSASHAAAWRFEGGKAWGSMH